MFIDPGAILSNFKLESTNDIAYYQTKSGFHRNGEESKIW
jgi:hypothetical protein